MSDEIERLIGRCAANVSQFEAGARTAADCAAAWDHFETTFAAAIRANCRAHGATEERARAAEGRARDALRNLRPTVEALIALAKPEAFSSPDDLATQPPAGAA
jgi:hypothetical protein